MNTWAQTETQKVIYEVLSQDAALQTLLGGTAQDKKVYDRVPQEKAFPFVTIGDVTWDERGNQTWEGWKGLITINVWYREPKAGRLGVQLIQKRIDELLHRQDPCVEGWNIVDLRRSSINIVIDPDNITIHGISKYNLYLGEA